MGRVALDLSNCFADVVGPENGVKLDEWDALRGDSRTALAQVEARRERDLRWLDLPYQDDVLEQVLAYAASARGRFRNVVVLGIGGSALGTSAIHGALNGPYHNLETPAGQPRLFVLDNIDPDWIGEFLETFAAEETLFNVISKSGGTAETMSQFLIFRQRLIEALGEQSHGQHLVVTTAAETGPLREIVTREGYASFVVPDGVGGRFSVLSAVGLLPLALVGVDVAALLAGAARMDERCKASDLDENPALAYAAMQYLMQTRKAKPMAVTFSYSQRLALLGDWYAQLLGESLGKRRSRAGSEVFAGPTPVRALGVTDQHSQVQLYVEGPFDKWFTFLAVEDSQHTVRIPNAYEDLEGVRYLGGHTLNELFAAEREGTRLALTEAGRPNGTVRLTSVTPDEVGQYLQMMEIAVAVMGEHYDVDAFDQPGVEAGKVIAYALMGRTGYEDRRAQIEGLGGRVGRVLD